MSETDLQPEINSSEQKGRDRSPLHSSQDNNDDNDSDMSGGGKDRDHDNDRGRRGDRFGRSGPRNVSTSRDRGGRRASADRRIFVSNVAYEFGWQELKDLFKREVGDVAYVDLFTDEHDKPRGCGIIEFDNPESVKRALEKMHRYELKGRKLVVKEDFDIERDKYGRPQKSGGRGGGGTGGSGGRMRDEPRNNWDRSSVSRPPNMSLMGQAGGALKAANTYGLSPQFLESLGITGPLVTRVFVANLDYKVDEKKLREVFKLAGKVVNAELNLDKDGKSRGFGVVEYDHPVEAVQAISMLHNQILFDRNMTVRMDRVDNKSGGTLRLPDGLRSIGMGLGAGGNPLPDVARNLPNSTSISSSLVGDLPSAATGNLGTGLGVAAALSSVVGQASLGLGNTGAAFPASLAGVGGLGAAGLMGGARADIGLGPNTGAIGGSILGGALGPAASGLGAPSLGGGGNVSYGGTSQTLLGSTFPGANRDFDSLSAALGGAGGVGNSGYTSGLGERDYRGSSGTGSNYANGPSRGGIGGLNTPAGSGGRKSDTVIVKNLPPSTTWQTLRDKFRDAGEVTFAEMRGKDIGFIRFRSEWDAERAVHMMDRSRLDGRTIDVALF